VRRCRAALPSRCTPANAVLNIVTRSNVLVGIEPECPDRRTSHQENRGDDERGLPITDLDEVGQVLDQLLDPSLELHCANHSDLEAKVTQGAAQVVLDGDGLRLQQLAMGQQHAQFLTAECLSLGIGKRTKIADVPVT
jgi:hypothetical protein